MPGIPMINLKFKSQIQIFEGQLFNFLASGKATILVCASSSIVRLPYACNFGTDITAPILFNEAQGKSFNEKKNS